jgi:hypothetical protein
MRTFDDLFTSYVTWLFRLPPTACKNAILSSFARRCTQCDALFLASVQLAGSGCTSNIMWRDLCHELGEGRRKSKWYSVLLAGLRNRGLADHVLSRGTDYVANRKQIAVKFSQYCFHNHLNCFLGTSGDDFRALKPFGIYPFLFSNSASESRFLFSFILSCWRWLDGGICSDYPQQCYFCECRNTSWHLLFDCPLFCDIRDPFESATGRKFEYDCLLSDVPPMPVEVARVGRALHRRVRELCSRVPIDDFELEGLFVPH